MPLFVSFLNRCQHMKLHLTNAYEIKTFDNVVRLFKLKENHLAPLSVKVKTNLASSSTNRKFKKNVTKPICKRKAQKKKATQVQVPKKKRVERKPNIAKL